MTKTVVSQGQSSSVQGNLHNLMQHEVGGRCATDDSGMHGWEAKRFGLPWLTSRGKGENMTWDMSKNVFAAGTKTRNETAEG